MDTQDIARGERGFCGFARAEGYLLPGNTWNAEIQFDANKCKDAVYSVVAKLSEFSKHEDDSCTHRSRQV